MTTPDELDGGGAPDVPFLPPPTRPIVESNSPSAGVSAPPAPAAGSEPNAGVAPEFDATAMVASQRRMMSSPAYGALPGASDSGREAALRLRREADRKRRRNERLGWAVATVMLVGVFAAGWFSYVAFRNDASAGTGALESDDRAGEGGAAEAADPLLETTLNSTVPDDEAAPDPVPTVAGTATTVAATIVGEEPGAQPPETVPPELQGPPPRIANRPSFRTVLFELRVFDGADLDGPFKNFSAVYDTTTDSYFGIADDSATGQSEIISFDGEWRYSKLADGSSRRIRRSDISLEPEPDTIFGRVPAETDILPLPARPYSTLRREEPTTLAGPDGTPVTVYGYLIDTAGFRIADPVAYSTWQEIWTARHYDDPTLVVAGTEEERLSTEVGGIEGLTERETLDLSEFDVPIVDDRASLVFTVTERGLVNSVTFVDPVANVRVVYVATDFQDAPAGLVFPEEGWVDAS